MISDKKTNLQGWIIVAYGILTMLFVHYGVMGSQAVFMLPMTKDLYASTSQLSFASTITTMLSIVILPFAGKIFAKKSVRLWLFIGIAGTSLTMVLQSFVTSLYQYYAIIVIRSFFSCFVTALPFPVLTSRWFDTKNRAFATSLVFAGISLGGMLLASPLANLIANYGWRTTYRYYGIFCLAILAPLGLFLVKDFPENYAQRIQTEKIQTKTSMLDLLKDKRFVLLCIGIGSIFFMGSSMYLVSIIVQSLGYDAAFGAKIIAIYNLVCVFFKIIAGKVFDKKGLKTGVYFSVAGTTIAYILLIIANIKSSVLLLIIFAVFYGIGNVSQSVTPSSLVAGVFGVKNFSEVYSKMDSVTYVISAFATPIMAKLYEISGSYLSTSILCTVLSLIAITSLLKICDSSEKFS